MRIILSIILSIPLLSPVLSGQASSSVLSYGAVADGILRTDGAMFAGSSVLTSPSGSFASGDAGKYIQVIGAGPGGTSHGDAIMSAGSATLTSPSGTFAASDVGRGIVVTGAGAQGGNLVTTIQTFNSTSSVTLNGSAQTSVNGMPYFYGAMTLEATIQSVQSSTTISLSSPALATISGATFAYGTEDHAAFQSAVDAAGQAGGGTVNVPAPTSCPTGAVCGYVVKASDQTTAVAPSAVKIRYNNVSLVGSTPQTNLFCRGAYGLYSNTVAYPGATGYIRGFCLDLGDNGGPNGAAGEAVSNVTVAKLHLYGMTNGNTFNNNFAYPPQATDGWDVTHKGIYMWNNSAFSNITINSIIVQDFKGENIFSGGSVVTGMVIENSTLTNFNGDGISVQAAGLQVLNNTISNGSNAAVENSTVSTGAGALVQQLYQGNTISQFPREGIVVVGVDSGVAAGQVQILGNSFDTIAQINPSGTQSAIDVGSQNNNVPPANVTVTGNTCHDCYSFGVLQTNGNTLVQGNTFTVDKYNCSNFLSFTYPITGTTISSNTGSLTTNAQSNGLSIGSVYQINPGFTSGGFPWKNVVLKGNTWTFPGAPQYQFVTSSGLGWNLVTQDNLNWQGDVCNGCTHADANHGLISLSQSRVIEPYGPVVYVTGGTGAATVDASKEENGAQVQIVNAGTGSISFSSDNNLSLAGTIDLAGGGSGSATFVYNSTLGKYTLLGSAAQNIAASGGTPQTTPVNTMFPMPMQATVTDGNGNLLSGVAVTFTAPSTAATGSFGGLSTATVVAGANGVASAPSFTANGQAGSYSVLARVAGSSTPAAFSLTNTASVVPPSQGSLTGSGSSSSASVNLTSEGDVDWVHWGDGTLNRKSGVSPQLSSYAVIGSGIVSTYNNDPRPISWTDGTPTQSSTNNTNGIYISGLGQGISFTAPADTTLRNLVVHVGGWSSGGTLTAHLSDNSAPDFTDVTAAASGQFDRDYTITYSAGSAGQTLTVSWIMTSGASYGNVTFNAAALAGSTIQATLGTPQSTAINTAFPIAIQATVLDAAGNPVSGASVTFTAPTLGPTATFAGLSTATVATNTSGVATGPSLTANGQTGSYSVLASVAGVASTAIFNLTNSAAAGSSGSLTGSATSSSATVNLTAEGGVDWVHWGDGTLNRKSGVTPHLSTYSVIGNGAVSIYHNDPRPISWTDGTPTQSSTNNTNGIYINSTGQGFSFTVPADTTVQSLVVHVGGWMSGGTLTAHLSDNSAPDFTDVTAVTNNQYDRNYTLTYSAASSGRSLTISWTMTSGSGNVTLNAAALTGSGISAASGTPQSTAIDTSFALSLGASVEDAGGNPVSGASVTFTAPTTGPGVTFAGSSTATVTTNAMGLAVAPLLTANREAGTYVVTASAAGIAANASFSLTNTAGAPSSIVPSGGTPQSATVSSMFATPLQATVKDSGGNLLGDVSVTFSAPGSGASASFGGASSAVAITNANGVATAPALTADGVAGTYIVTASALGVATPANYSLTNTAPTAPVPASISAIAGSSQSATVNAAFSVALQALVTQSNGNPLSGATVLFTAPSSGPSATFGGSATATALTNSSGIATAPALTANGQSGGYSVLANVSGLSTGASFTLTNLAVALPGGGALSGSANNSSSAVNLTAEGTSDWINWNTSTVRKSGVTPQISTYTLVGAGPALNYSNDPRAITWSDGSPIVSSSNNTTGIYVNNLHNGYSLTAPADGTTRTLIIHLGGDASGGTLTAHLSDSSAPDFVDITSTIRGQYDRNYTIVYSAASAGQTLRVTWLDTSGGGNVTLSAAALQ
jgi:hypothetical protein